MTPFPSVAIAKFEHVLVSRVTCDPSYITATSNLTETKLHVKLLLVLSEEPIRTRVNGVQV